MQKRVAAVLAVWIMLFSACLLPLITVRATEGDAEEKEVEENEQLEVAPEGNIPEVPAVDEEGYLIDENGERILDDDGNPVPLENSAVEEEPENANVNSEGSRQDANVSIEGSLQNADETVSEEPVEADAENDSCEDGENRPRGLLRSPAGIPEKTDSCTLRIVYVDKDGNKLLEDHVEELEKGSSFSVESPYIEGYTYSTWMVYSPAEGIQEDMEITVYYWPYDSTKQAMPYVIYYLDRNGLEIRRPSYSTIAAGEEYYAEPEDIPGYQAQTEPESGVASGSKGSVEVYFYYDRLCTITLHFIDDDTEEELQDPQTLYYSEDEFYEIEGPEIEGYVYAGGIYRNYVEGDEEIRLRYLPADYFLEEHYLIISYVDDLAPEDENLIYYFVQPYKKGKEYRVESPVRPTFEPDIEVVEGVMGTENIEVTVTYSSVYDDEIIPEEEVQTVIDDRTVSYDDAVVFLTAGRSLDEVDADGKEKLDEEITKIFQYIPQNMLGEILMFDLSGDIGETFMAVREEDSISYGARIALVLHYVERFDEVTVQASEVMAGGVPMFFNSLSPVAVVFTRYESVDEITALGYTPQTKSDTRYTAGGTAINYWYPNGEPQGGSEGTVVVPGSPEMPAVQPVNPAVPAADPSDPAPEPEADPVVPPASDPSQPTQNPPSDPPTEPKDPSNDPGESKKEEKTDEPPARPAEGQSQSSGNGGSSYYVGGGGSDSQTGGQSDPLPVQTVTEITTEIEPVIADITEDHTERETDVTINTATEMPQSIVQVNDEEEIPDDMEEKEIVINDQIPQGVGTDAPRRKPFGIQIVFICGGGAFLFLFLWWRGRRITGTVIDAYGQPHPELKVKLTGKDSLHMLTNPRGEFAFYNLKKALYVLSVENDAGRLIFEAEIYYDGDGKNEEDEIVNVLYSPDASYKISHFGRKIHIDLEERMI